MGEKIVVDADGEVLGRIAAFSAKKALQGNEIAIINCNNILITGNRGRIVKDYLQSRRRTKVRFPSTPEKIMKRTIRGMINYKSGRGALAFKKIKCYNVVPEEYKGKGIKLGNKNKDLMDLKDLSNELKRGKN